MLLGGHCRLGMGSFTPRAYSSVCWCRARFLEGVTTGKCIFAWVCGAQLTPELSALPISVVVVGGAVGWSGIPTKTLLVCSQFSGRLFSFARVPLHVLRTRSSGRVYLLYLILLERDLSWSRQSFRELRILFLASRWEMFLTGYSGEVSKSLVHLSFQIRNAHLDIIIRKSVTTVLLKTE